MQLSLQPFYLLECMISSLLKTAEGKNLNGSKVSKIRKSNKLQKNPNKPSIYLSPYQLSHCIRYYHPCCLQLPKQSAVYQTLSLLSCQSSSMTSPHVQHLYVVFLQIFDEI